MAHQETSACSVGLCDRCVIDELRAEVERLTTERNVLQAELDSWQLSCDKKDEELAQLRTERDTLAMAVNTLKAEVAGWDESCGPFTDQPCGYCQACGADMNSGRCVAGCHDAAAIPLPRLSESPPLDESLAEMMADTAAVQALVDAAVAWVANARQVAGDMLPLGAALARAVDALPPEMKEGDKP